MPDRQQLWSLMGETMQAFGPFYREAMHNAIQASGAPNSWFALSLARGSDPVPFSVERFQALAPYTARRRVIQILEELAGLELLERVGEDAYRITDLGREAVEDIFEVAQESLGTISPLPETDMEQLNGLLYRLVEATLTASEPEDKWSIRFSRWTDPGERAPGAAKADQYMTDLYRFRDDAHIAAWKPYAVDGHAWEALTFFWRGDASTAEELAEKLPFRGHSVEVYEEALRDLVHRGWLAKTPDGYHITQEGRALRQRAEEVTDRFFFSPWECLSESETAQLHDLLVRLRDSLQRMAAHPGGQQQ